MRFRGEVRQQLLGAFGPRVGGSIFEVLDMAVLGVEPVSSTQSLCKGQYSASGKNFTKVTALHQSFDFGNHSGLGVDASLDNVQAPS